MVSLQVPMFNGVCIIRFDIILVPRMQMEKGACIIGFDISPYTVEPFLKDHPIGHKMWSVKTGGLC